MNDVIFNSCFGIYRFVFHKEKIKISFNDSSFQYIVTIQVYDNIDVPVIDVKLSEIDVIDLIASMTGELYNIFEFCEMYEGIPYSVNNKRIGSLMDTIFIKISCIEDFPEAVDVFESMMWSEYYSEPRELKFSIEFSNAIDQVVRKAVEFPVCRSEILLIADCLYKIISDIEFSAELGKYLEDIMDTFLNFNYKFRGGK